MKAQGLPLNTIVLGALAVLVLVLLAAAFVPGVGGMFQSIFGVAGTSQQQFIATCQSACNNLDYIYSSSSGTTAITASTYCTATNDDGEHCCDTNVGVACTIHSTDGETITIETSDNCDCGSPTWS